MMNNIFDYSNDSVAYLIESMTVNAQHIKYLDSKNPYLIEVAKEYYNVDCSTEVLRKALDDENEAIMVELCKRKVNGTVNRSRFSPTLTKDQES